MPHVCPWWGGYFLDTAEMTHALAIAYDWLYDAWSQSQRATIRRAMVQYGLKPGLEVYKAHRWWAQCDHNWNQVCNGGLTLGALAIGDEEPELCGEILHDALTSVQLAMHSYAPDGGWGEGPESQRSNDGVRKLAIHLLHVTDLRLAVGFIPLDGSCDADWKPEIKALADW